MKNKIFAADLFCGAGGESTGLLEACAELGIDVDLLAVNHWDIAIQTHTKNHPNVRHMCESIQNVDPLKAVPSGRLHLLWASPECTHHSNARGGRPRSDQSRASAWLILKWLSELYVDRVIIENVPEFINWGPIGANGEVLKSKKGYTFRAFCDALRAIGYKVDYRILCAANYGDPTTRKRFFLQAVRGKNKISWPAVTHTQGHDMYASKRWVPAKDIIDWSIPGKSIFDRKKPLAENTLKRIEHGIKKYWGEYAEPFLIILRGTGTSRSIDRPIPTVTTSGSHFGLVAPFITVHKGCSLSRGLDEPLNTVTTRPCHSIVEPFITRFNGGDNRNHQINEPLPTLDCSNRYGVVEPFIFSIGQTSAKDRSRSLNDPLSTVVTKAEHCLVEPLIIDMTHPKENHNSRVQSSNDTVKTVTCRNNMAVVKPFLLKYYGSGSSIADIDNPLDTVTTKDRFAIIDGDLYSLDIRFRMLLPHELAAAQGFPKSYYFAGNKSDIVKQIGNAVPRKMARAICKAQLAV